MNNNFIAPEALDDNVIPECRHCKARITAVEQKIKFFQGECPNCGLNQAMVDKKPARKRGSFTLESYAFSTPGWIAPIETLEDRPNDPSSF